MQLKQLNKSLQKSCYTFLNSTAGACILFVSAVITINACLHTIDEALGTSLICESFPLHDYTDNIAGRSHESTLCTEPIDAVYTWVNGSEDAHRAEVAFWQLQQELELGLGVPLSPNAAPSGTVLPATSNLSEQQLLDQSSRSRFEDHEELRYSLRGLERYAGWIRHVYIVTNGQVPTWLDLSHPRVTIVPHSAIFPNPSHLPTFSSPAIEANLHRIPGLSKRFVYLNDDTFFGAPVVPDNFESPTSGIRLYYSWPVPACADGCPAAWLGDGTCDKQCNTTDCDNDAGDCVGDNVKLVNNGGAHAMMGRNTRLAANCNGMCADGWLGDKFCDSACSNAECGYDATDCGMQPYLDDSAFPKLRVHTPFTSFRLPYPATKAFLVNVSALLPFNVSRITAGDHATPSWVRTATMSQLHKVLVVTIAGEPQSHPARCRFFISGEVDVPSVQTNSNATASAGNSNSSNTTMVAANNTTTTRVVTIHFNVTLVFAAAVAVTPAPTPSSNPSPSPAPSSAPAATLLAATQQTPSPAPPRPAAGSLTAGPQTHGPPSTQRSLQALGRSVDGILSVDDEAKSTQRRLQDMFGDSLKYTNKLLSKRFRSVPRSVPAHMAHLIHTEVVEALWRQWPAEWGATSASKFRSRHNLQYAFMHYYYVVHAKRVLPPADFFATVLDANRNGFLDNTERRRVRLMLWEKNIPMEALEAACKAVYVRQFPAHEADNATGWEVAHDAETRRQEGAGASTPHRLVPTTAVPTTKNIPMEAPPTPAPTVAPIAIVAEGGQRHRNASAHAHTPPPPPPPPTPAPAMTRAPLPHPDDNIRPAPQRYHDLADWLLDAAAKGWGTDHDMPSYNGRLTPQLLFNSHIGSLLMEHYGTVDAYRRTLEELDDVTFVMVRNNATVVQHQMDHVLFKRPKFLCINDDMNHSHADHGAVLQAVQTLLDTYFPLPSSFELPDGGRNSFTRFTPEEIRWASSSLLSALADSSTDGRHAVLRNRGAKASTGAVGPRVVLAVAVLILAVFVCVRKLAAGSRR